MTGRRCGNDPRAELTDGDRQAIAEFRQYLAARKAEAADTPEPPVVPAPPAPAH